jgi:hypothetical protein
MNPSNDANANDASLTPFWPLLLMGCSLAIFLGWQVFQGQQQHANLLRLQGQQEQITKQAAQEESRLQSLMMDLLTLSRTDADAKAIVTKYNIKFNAPKTAPSLPVSPATPLSTPSFSERPAAAPKPPATPQR